MSTAVSFSHLLTWISIVSAEGLKAPEKWFVDHCDVMLLCVRCLTAPQGPVRHWWDWLRGRLFRALVFGEDGKGRDTLERDGH